MRCGESVRIPVNETSVHFNKPSPSICPCEKDPREREREGGRGTERDIVKKKKTTPPCNRYRKSRPMSTNGPPFFEFLDETSFFLKTKPCKTKTK